MAVNELLNRVVGFRKRNMGFEISRRFLYAEDRATSGRRAVLPDLRHTRHVGSRRRGPVFLDVVR